MAEIIWVHSNRVDDRTVLWERAPEHPGGEAFVGGNGPARVAKTLAVDEKLRNGELIEIPEPPDSNRKPVAVTGIDDAPWANQPGQPIQLGRSIDHEIVPEDMQDMVSEQQSDAPDEIPVPKGVEMPADESESSRRGRRG